MFRKRVRPIIAAVTAGILLIGNICFAADETQKENVPAVGDSLLAESKESAKYTSAENIYATLKADGSFENAYVINSFDVEKAGEIVNYGSYDFIKNLTTLDGIQSRNGVQTFAAPEGKFYYQGNKGDLKLPWNVSITYLLDGKKVSADELAGKSGALEIIVKTKKEPSVNPAFYDNYMLQATFTLDMETCGNIVAKDAAVAEAGSNKTVIFTGLPGRDAEMHLTADVKEFEMAGASIAAVPFSMAFEMPDTDEMVDGLTQLADAIRQLDAGVGELTDGMNTLADNAGTLKEGSGNFAKGIGAVSANSDQLMNASSQIRDALQGVAGSLEAVDMSSMAELAKLPGALNELAGALEQVQSGLGQVPLMYRQAYGGINEAIGNVSGAALSGSELAALKEAAQAGGDGAMQAYQRVEALNALAERLEQAQAEAGQVDSVVQTLDKTAEQIAGGLRQMAGGMSEQLESQDIAGAMDTLQSGMKLLAGSYIEFHSGLAAYTEGVDTLAAGYGQLDKGLNAYLNGVALAVDGTETLKEGTSQLAVSTKDIPEEMQKQIDAFMEDYQFDFTPVSFLDERNTAVESVQFILSTPKIAVPEAEEAEEAAEEKRGILDRLKNLFSAL